MAALRVSAGSPKYDLSRAKVLVQCCRIGRTELGKVVLFTGLSETRAVFHVMTLFESLTPDDFANNWEARDSRTGSAIVADVYGKNDEYGLWYIKFRIVEPRLALLSCKEAEEDILLANKTRLGRRTK